MRVIIMMHFNTEACLRHLVLSIDCIIIHAHLMCMRDGQSKLRRHYSLPVTPLIRRWSRCPTNKNNTMTSCAGHLSSETKTRVIYINVCISVDSPQRLRLIIKTGIAPRSDMGRPRAIDRRDESPPCAPSRSQGPTHWLTECRQTAMNNN